jgi:hypothetical protein
MCRVVALCSRLPEEKAADYLRRPMAEAILIIGEYSETDA